jgi:hypothetical protein
LTFPDFLYFLERRKKQGIANLMNKSCIVVQALGFSKGAMKQLEKVRKKFS